MGKKIISRTRRHTHSPAPSLPAPHCTKKVFLRGKWLSNFHTILPGFWTKLGYRERERGLLKILLMYAKNMMKEIRYYLPWQEFPMERIDFLFSKIIFACIIFCFSGPYFWKKYFKPLELDLVLSFWMLWNSMFTENG